MKEQLLSVTRKQVEDLAALQRSIKSVPTKRVSRKQPLDAGAATARHWFDVVRPALEKAQFSKDAIEPFSRRFEELLRISGGEPMKAGFLQCVAGILQLYRQQIVHQIEIGSFATAAGLSIAPYIAGLPVAEGDYLDEAQRCLSVEALRGCIVLGWCATVARIHEKIGQIGYEKFTQATAEMAAKTTGRFKAFNKKLPVDSLSDLQRVFDTDVLFVLEYMQLIDSNQHSRLRHCFDMRNHSAHPGQAPITGENLYSFFSDITQIVLKNPKFTLAPNPKVL
jgi:hypothetical protein